VLVGKVNNIKLTAIATLCILFIIYTIKI